MDEITRKVVDGTAWREFCDLLADAGEAILAEGNPDDPLDRAEGFRMLTRLLRGALESDLEYGRPEQPVLVRACHETVKIVGENPDNHYLGASPRREVRLPDLGHAGRGEVDQLQPLLRRRLRRRRSRAPGATLHEEQMHIEPDGTFELVISQREHPGNWLRSEADTRSPGHPPDLPRPAQPGARRAPHRAHRRRRRAARAADPRGALPRAHPRRLLREGRGRDRRPVGGAPVAVAQRVHRRGRGRPRPTSSRTPRSSGTRPTSTSTRTRPWSWRSCRRTASTG